MEQVRNDPPSGVTIDDYVSFFCIVHLICSLFHSFDIIVVLWHSK
jgi:hypothetical protein